MCLVGDWSENSLKPGEQPTVSRKDTSMASTALTAVFEPESADNGNSGETKATWTRTKGFTYMTLPVYFSPEGEIGRDILPIMSKHVKQLYLEYRDAESAASASLKRAVAPEERAFYRGQLAILAKIRENFQVVQRSSKGLVNWRLAPENSEKVEQTDRNLEAAILNNQEEVA
jgi:hypothetical protein